MNTKAWGALAAADSQILWRDPLLGWVLLLPLSVAVMLRLLIPAIERALPAGSIDLAAYHPLIMSGYLMTAPGIVGMVVGFMLLDERDARTLSALRVTPLSMRQYLAYRLTLPLIVGTAITLIAYPVAAMTPLPLSVLVPLAMVAGLSAPSLALLLALAAPNKVAGFAVVKVLNLINLLPLIAYFVPAPINLVAGILPAFWPMRALWAAAAEESALPFVLAGTVWAGIVLTITALAFERRLGLRS